MAKNLERMKFSNEPLEELIFHLDTEADKWCLEHCLDYGYCFEKTVFKIKNIRQCKKIPKTYKLYWEAKNSNISAIAPLIIFHAKEKKNEK